MKYDGPYPFGDLKAAREMLRSAVMYRGNRAWETFKSRLGVRSRVPNGTALEDFDDSAGWYEIYPQFEEMDNLSILGVSKKKNVTKEGTSQTKSQPTSTSTLSAKNSDKTPVSTTVTCTNGEVAQDSAETTIGANNTLVIERNEQDKKTSVLKGKRKLDGDVLNGHPSPNKRWTQEDDGTAVYFKCDFCSWHSIHNNEVEQHLTDAKHYSASRYQAKDQDGKLLFISIVEKLVAVNKEAKCVALVACCPNCHLIFEDIYQCAVHFKNIHGKKSLGKAQFSIVPVIDRETIIFSRETCKTCKKCGRNFKDYSHLAKHYKETNHYPYRTHGKQVIQLFSCLYCDRKFPHNCHACQLHVFEHKAYKPADSNVAMVVQSILKPTKAMELLPMYQPMTAFEELKDEHDTLMGLTNHAEQLRFGKGTKKGIKNRIKEIRKLMPSKRKYHVNQV